MEVMDNEEAYQVTECCLSCTHILAVGARERESRVEYDNGLSCGFCRFALCICGMSVWFGLIWFDMIWGLGLRW